MQRQIQSNIISVFSAGPAVSKARHADVAQARWSGMKRRVSLDNTGIS